MDHANLPSQQDFTEPQVGKAVPSEQSRWGWVAQRMHMVRTAYDRFLALAAADCLLEKAVYLDSAPHYPPLQAEIAENPPFVLESRRFCADES